MYRILFTLSFFIGVQARISDDHWIVIQDGRPTTPVNPVNFERHPKREGQLVRDIYPALYIDDQHNLNFGQTTTESSRKICAFFNNGKTGQVESICGGYRVLSKARWDDRFTLVKPENYDSQKHILVEFQDAVNYQRILVLIWEPDTQSSYFGTLVKEHGQEPVAYGINYDNAPVEIRGTQATSGDYLMYVVQEKAF